MPNDTPENVLAWLRVYDRDKQSGKSSDGDDDKPKPLSSKDALLKARTMLTLEKVEIARDQKEAGRRKLIPIAESKKMIERLASIVESNLFGMKAFTMDLLNCSSAKTMEAKLDKIARDIMTAISNAADDDDDSDLEDIA